MKKISSVIAIVLCIVLSFPIVSGATSSSSPFAPKIHTLDSVTGYYSDSTLNQEQRYLSNYNGDYIDTFYEKFSELESIIDVSYNYWAAYLYYNSTTGLEHYTIAVRVWNDTADLIGIATPTNTTTLQSTYDVVYSCKDSVTSYYHGKIYSYNFNSVTPQWNWEWIYSGSNTDEFASLSDAIIILDTNIPIYLNENIIANGGSQVTTSNALQFVPSTSYNIFFNNDLPYADSSNSIINPNPPQAVQDNSIAFRKIDLSTIYSYTSKAHCAGLLAWELDPVGYSVIDNNAAGWTMHYNILVTYKWDTSMDNVVFRPFYNGGSASGTVTWDIDIAPTGSIKANEQKFDIYDLLNTYQVSQGSSADIANLGLAVYALKNGKGSVLGDFFGQLGQDITDISTQIGQANLFSINGYSANDISQIFTPTYTYALTHLDMQVVAYPVNNVTHIKGKSGTTKLNLVTNTNSSYAQGAEITDSESGYDIVSPDYESSGDTVVTPVNTGGGSQVYVVINNPSSNNNGGGSSSSSSSSPSINIDNGGTISFDPGYRDLRNDVISSENDWGQYFLPFKDSNGVGELFGSFLDNMPDELKVIFIGGFGVLTCFAIYRFIRRG